MPSSISPQDGPTQAAKFAGAEPHSFQPEQFVALLNNLESGGNTIPAGIIRENVYAEHPRQLLEKYRRNGDEPVFFFHKLQKTGKKAKRKISSSSRQQNGQWTATKGKSEICDEDGSVIGITIPLMYYEYANDGSKKKQNTGWHMKEFRLPKSQTTNKLLEPTFCKIFYRGSKEMMKELEYYKFTEGLHPICNETEFPQLQDSEGDADCLQLDPYWDRNWDFYSNPDCCNILRE